MSVLHVTVAKQHVCLALVWSAMYIGIESAHPPLVLLSSVGLHTDVAVCTHVGLFKVATGRGQVNHAV